MYVHLYKKRVKDKEQQLRPVQLFAAGAAAAATPAAAAAAAACWVIEGPRHTIERTLQ